MTMSAHEVLTHLRKRQGPDDVPRALAELAPAEQFTALWPIAVERQSETNPSSPAAYVLCNLNPPCPLECDAAIAALLPKWDISIEEVPWYLAKQCGGEVVARTAEMLARERSDEVERALLAAVAYWVRVAKAPR